MMEFLDVLKTVRLFDGIKADQLAAMLSCLGAKTVQIHKDEYVLSAGDTVDHVGIVLSGRFHVIREDCSGSRVLLTALMPGDAFAETLCCAGIKESPVSVLADTGATAMLLSFQRILHTCPNTCSFHTRLIANMLQVIAAKNLQLQNRIEFVSKKSIRARLMSYLESVAAKQGREFSIPFNREQLADFLCIDRSALSRELGRLKEDGVVDYWKNQFRLAEEFFQKSD